MSTVTEKALGFLGIREWSGVGILEKLWFVVVGLMGYEEPKGKEILMGLLIGMVAQYDVFRNKKEGHRFF